MFARLHRIPLRVSLIAAVLLLVAVALAGISVVITMTMYHSLQARLDTQLRSANSAAHAGFEHGLRSIYIVGVDYGVQTDISGQPVLPGLTVPRSASYPPLVSGSAAVRAVDGKLATVSAPDGTQWRVLVTMLPDGTVLHLGERMSNVDDVVGRMIHTEIVVGIVVLFLLAILGAGLVRVSLDPLAQIERTAKAIAAGDLAQRVPDPEPDVPDPNTEVGRLARSLNAMLGQIEDAFAAKEASQRRAVRSEERMRQFVADASHELRTPLTSIRGFAELYRQGAAGPPEQADRLIRRIEDEAARMGLLVEDLLLLARLDEQRPIARDPVDLRVVAGDAVAAASATAPERSITMEVPAGTGQLVVCGDDLRLRQVVGNLMTNALTHTPAGTPVCLRLHADGERAVLEVVDHGPGLTAEQAQRVFERFYRADPARTRRGGEDPASPTGTGLGLAIVAALVGVHGGTVEVDATAPTGATFRVRLPLVPADSPALVGGQN